MPRNAITAARATSSAFHSGQWFWRMKNATSAGPSSRATKVAARVSLRQPAASSRDASLESNPPAAGDGNDPGAVGSRLVMCAQYGRPEARGCWWRTRIDREDSSASTVSLPGWSRTSSSVAQCSPAIANLWLSEKSTWITSTSWRSSSLTTVGEPAFITTLPGRA